jgi:hypothetical protein
LHKKEKIKNKKMAPRGTNRVPLVPLKNSLTKFFLQRIF